MNSKKKIGFSLTEITLVLGLIGILAITMLSLNNFNTDNPKFSTLKLSQADNALRSWSKAIQGVDEKGLGIKEVINDQTTLDNSIRDYIINKGDELGEEITSEVTSDSYEIPTVFTLNTGIKIYSRYIMEDNSEAYDANIASNSRIAIIVAEAPDGTREEYNLHMNGQLISVADKYNNGDYTEYPIQIVTVNDDETDDSTSGGSSDGDITTDDTGDNKKDDDNGDDDTETKSYVCLKDDCDCSDIPMPKECKEVKTCTTTTNDNPTNVYVSKKETKLSCGANMTGEIIKRSISDACTDYVQTYSSCCPSPKFDNKNGSSASPDCQCNETKMNELGIYQAGKIFNKNAPSCQSNVEPGRYAINGVAVLCGQNIDGENTNYDATKTGYYCDTAGLNKSIICPKGSYCPQELSDIVNVEVSSLSPGHNPGNEPSDDPTEPSSPSDIKDLFNPLKFEKTSESLNSSNVNTSDIDNNKTIIQTIADTTETIINTITDMVQGENDEDDYPLGGLINPIKCPKRYYCPDDGLRTPKICRAGHYCPNDGMTTEYICPPGTYSEEGATECTPCNSGEFQIKEGQDHCDTCPDGKIAINPRTGECVKCAKWYHPANNDDEFVRDRATKCLPCPTETPLWNEEEYKCEPCPLETPLWNETTHECEPCPTATPLWDIATETCKPCPQGTYNDNNGSCLPCPGGTYQNEEGQTECKPCPQGTYLEAPSGDVGATSVEECHPCPPNSTTPEPTNGIGATDISECKCEAGFYAFDEINNTCPDDAILSEDMSCRETEAGFFSPEGNNCRIQCNCGNVTKDENGNLVTERASQCVACGQNQYSDPLTSETNQCKNKSSNFALDENKCSQICPAGYGLNNGVCEECPAGTYSDTPNGTCQSCACGKVTQKQDENGNLINVTTGATQCNACGSEYDYSNPHGDNQCKTRQENEIFDNNNPHCNITGQCDGLRTPNPQDGYTTCICPDEAESFCDPLTEKLDENTCSCISKEPIGAKTCSEYGLAGLIYIETADQLAKIGKDGAYPLSGHYCLVNNIDLEAAGYGKSYNNGDGWDPIGGGFSGVFDGNNKTISNLYINRPYTSHQGLFGMLSGNNPKIMNLGLVNVDIMGDGYTGGLVGYSYSNSEINNCYVTGKITGTGGYIGGLIGRGSGNITNSYTNCDVTGDVAGGLVGSGDSVTINASYATGTVSGIRSAGGLVGWSSTDITNSYTTGNVTGDVAGGLVGRGDYVYIKTSYATATVFGPGTFYSLGEVGGLAGGFDRGNISNSYATGDVTLVGAGYAGGLVGHSGSYSNRIDNCYTTNNIAANDAILVTNFPGGVAREGGAGGLVGENQGNITNSYYLVYDGTHQEGQKDAPKGLIGTDNKRGTPKTHDEMFNTKTFISDDLAANEKWSDNIWYFDCNNDYPRLRNMPAATDVNPIITDEESNMCPITCTEGGKIPNAAGTECICPEGMIEVDGICRPDDTCHPGTFKHAVSKPTSIKVKDGLTLKYNTSYNVLSKEFTVGDFNTTYSRYPITVNLTYCSVSNSDCSNASDKIKTITKTIYYKQAGMTDNSSSISAKDANNKAVTFANIFDVEVQNNCQPCACGTYTDNNNLTACKTVSTGYITVNDNDEDTFTNATKQIKCPAGKLCKKTNANNICYTVTDCPAGQYSDEGVMTCSACPSNSTTTADGPKNSINDCKCKAGYYTDDSCSDVINNTSCKTVDVSGKTPYNHYSPNYDNCRYTCPTNSSTGKYGTSSASDVSECHCNAGYAVTEGTYDSTNEVCDVTLDENSVCNAVGDTAYSPTNNNCSYSCPENSHSATETAGAITECKCDAGYSKKGTSAIAFSTNCSINLAVGSICEPVAAPRYSPQLDNCPHNCPSNAATSGDDTKTISACKCKAGYYTDDSCSDVVNNNSCKTVDTSTVKPYNHYSPENDNCRHTCPTNSERASYAVNSTYPAADVSECHCIGGYATADGNTPNDTDNACVSTGCMEYSPANDNSIHYCSIDVPNSNYGKANSDSQANCKIRTANSEIFDNENPHCGIITCPTNSTPNSDGTVCECKAGYYMTTNDGMPYCQACDCGTYNPDKGATSSSVCLSCGNNQYAPKGSAACSDVPSDGTITSNKCSFTCPNRNIKVFRINHNDGTTLSLSALITSARRSDGDYGTSGYCNLAWKVETHDWSFNTYGTKIERCSKTTECGRKECTAAQMSRMNYPKAQVRYFVVDASNGNVLGYYTEGGKWYYIDSTITSMSIGSYYEGEKFKGGTDGSQDNRYISGKISINGCSYTYAGSYRLDSPLVLDLKHNGLKFTNVENGVDFDLDGDGKVDRTAWTDYQTEFDDAFLCLDKNGNGQIDNGKELFGDQNGEENGFYELAKYDDNKDDKITPEDKAYNDLRLWCDFNKNAKVDKGELHTLAEEHITELSTKYQVQYDENGNIIKDENGNITGFVGTFKHLVEEVVNGVKTLVEKVGTMIDVFFQNISGGGE